MICLHRIYDPSEMSYNPLSPCYMKVSRHKRARLHPDPCLKGSEDRDVLSENNDTEM